MPGGLEEELRILVIDATEQAMEQFQKQLGSKDWFSLKEACSYAGVSNATFQKFRKMGLKVMVVDSVNRVSKKEIDRFMNEMSF